MDKSAEINELAAALSKAQSEIEDAAKDKSGYNYKYADLSQILQIVRPVFSKNGLSVSQFPSDSGSGISVDTILMHSSGQWLSNTFSMEVEAAKGMTKAQASGSVITYMRRYALAAVAGITQEDNDAAANRKEQQRQYEELDSMIVKIRILLDETEVDELVFLNAMKFGKIRVEALTGNERIMAIAALEKKKEKMKRGKIFDEINPVIHPEELTGRGLCND